MKSRKAVIKMPEDVAPVPCPCGMATRIIAKSDGSPVSFHRVAIRKDSEVHFHKKTTEIYHVVKGSGSIYLDGEILPITVGSTILIPPGVRHRAIGDLEIINVVHPPFDPADEFRVPENEVINHENH
jgi:mannose-6-phosphate isomerase-like protein (cupin superfamily)